MCQNLQAKHLLQLSKNMITLFTSYLLHIWILIDHQRYIKALTVAKLSAQSDI